MLTVGRGMVDFTKQVINSGAQLSRMSTNLGVSTDRLSRWTAAVKINGGTAEGFLGTMQSLSNSLTELSTTGNTGILQYLQQLRVGLKNADGSIKTTEELLQDIGEALRTRTTSRSDAFNIGRAMGIDDATLNLLLKGRGEVEKLLNAQKAYTDQEAKAALAASERWEQAKIRLERLSQSIVIKLIPVFERMVDEAVKFAEVIMPPLEKSADLFNTLNEKTNGWLASLTAALVTLRLITGPNILGGLTAMVSSIAKLGMLGAAGAGGYAAGSYLYENAIKGTDADSAIGRTVAKGLAFFGNKNAQQALNNEAGIVSHQANNDIASKFSAAEKANGLPPGTLAAIMKQETGNRKDFIDDPSKYHYEMKNGKRKSSAFGWFGILDSTAKDPGYGIQPLKNKSVDEQIRFASQYAAARIKAAGGDVRKGLAAYGEGDKYASQVMANIPNSMGNLAMINGGSGSKNISIGEIKVYTQATDAGGITRDMYSALVRQADTGMR